MKFVLVSFISWTMLLNSQSAHAQLDSSYELLLGVPIPAETAKVDKEKPNTAKKRRVASENSETSSDSMPEPKVESAGSVKTGRPLPIKLEPAAGENYGDPASQSANPEPTLTAQAQSLFTAHPEKVLTYYRDQFAESDPRHNKVEILFAPSFVTNESSSNYSYRNYRSVFSGLMVGANVWLTPAIGIGGNFLFSLGGDTSGDAATGTRSPARHEIFDLALKLRQFYGFTSQSRSIQFDILFSDYKFNVPSDDLHRARLKTSGLGLKTMLRLPSSPDFAWNVGGSFFPRLQHSESSAGSTISSGENSENVRIGLHLGTDYKLSKESQIFFEASANSERNLFGGSASLVDPATGGIPKNSSVTNTFYMMNLGYRWGN